MDNSSYSEIRCYIDSKINSNITKIREWLSEHYIGKELPFYGSVDIRNAGFKVAPVDTNLFPAGFNNLCQIAQQRGIKAFSRYFREHQISSLLVIGEDFTRNKKYFDNLASLNSMLSNAGIKVQLGIFGDSENDGNSINKIMRSGGKLFVEGSAPPEAILLNTDLVYGVPDILVDIEQIIIPPPTMGWHNRRKSKHFEIYNGIVQDFCSEFDLDAWLISTYIARSTNLDFRNKSGLDRVAEAVEDVICKTKKKYTEYGIKEQPVAFIKADNGTFGLGIMVASCGEEVININKKKRHSMNIVKSGVQNSEVVIQEGVRTIHKSGTVIYENVAYFAAGEIVAFLRRENEALSNLESLNVTSSTFSCDSNFQYSAEAVVAELAMLASAYEFEYYNSRR